MTSPTVSSLSFERVCTSVRDSGDERVAVKLTVAVLVLPGKLDISYACTPAFQRSQRWVDHPLMLLDEEHLDGDVVDDTPAVRALIEEARGEVATLGSGTTTQTTHLARLISAISLFWN